MKTRGIVIVLLVLAVCAVAWSASLLAEDTAPPAAPSRDEHAAGAQPGSGDRAAHMAASATQRDTVAAPAPVRFVRVTTVDARGDAVAGAEVRYWPPGSRGEREDAARSAGTNDVEVSLRAGGRSAVTDARGVVEIEADERSPVCARKGDAYGEAVLGGADTRWADELRLELLHDVAVSAEVVDEDGRPVADLAVAITATFESRFANAAARAAAITGSDGVATFAHVLQALAWPADATAGRLRFFCEVAGTERVLAERTVPFDPRRPPERVQLVVPSSGTVVVIAKDVEGAQLEPECWLEDGRGDFRQATRTGDRSVFHQVPFGMRWTLVLRGGAYRHQRTIEGPDADQPVVNVAVTVPLRPVELRARVVRSGGDPVAGAQIAWTCPALANHAVELTTDEHGVIPFGRLFLHGSREQDRDLEIAVSSPHVVPRTFRFERRIARGTTDLGDLVVAPASGEVLLASVDLRLDGMPVRDGAWARLRTTEEVGGAGATRTKVRLGGQAGDAPIPAFTLQVDVPAFMRRVGDTIELRGQPPEHPFVLHCGHPDCVTVRELPVALGEHKVVELQRAATLRVSIVPPDVERTRISGMLARLGEKNGKHAPFVAAQSSLTFEDIPPGPYSLRVDIDGCTIHETAAIVLAAGDNRWPLGGTPLDLRTAVRMIQVRAVEAGTRKRVAVQVVDVPAGSIAPVEARSRGPAFPGQGGSASAVWHPLPARPVDLLVRAFGYAPVRVAGVTGDVDVQLQRAIHLELEADGATDVKVRIRIVEDAVRDDALRSFDLFNGHQPETEYVLNSRFMSIPPFVPGTVLELSLVRNDTPGTPQRVEVGTTSPQKVALR